MITLQRVPLEAYVGLHNEPYDANRADWRPGMKEPLVRRSSNEHRGESYVLASSVKEALVLLESGDIKKAIAKLRKLCPDIPDLPAFEIA